MRHGIQALLKLSQVIKQVKHHLESSIELDDD